MKDYGNDPDWFTDAGGNRYHRKPTAKRMPRQAEAGQETERLWLYGPGTGHKRTDKVFDGLITALIIGVCLPIAWAMVGMLRTPEPAIERDTGTIECQR